MNDIFKSNMGFLDFLGGIGSAVGAIYTNNKSLKAQQSMLNQTQDFNQQEAEKQRLWQEMMWNQNNEYNTPMAQMERARAAGLNPSLLYGQPIAESQAASGGAEASIGTPSVPRLGNPLEGFGSLAAQTDLMRAQAEEIRSRIPLNQQKVVNLRKSLEDIDASVKKKLSDIERNGILNRLTDAQIGDIGFNQDIARASLDQAERRLISDIGLNEQKIKESKQAIRESMSRQHLNEENLNQMVAFFSLKKALAGSEILKNLEQKDYFKAASRQAEETANKLKKEGVRIDQIINLDLPAEDRAKTMYEDANSNNPLVRFGGQLMYAIDYGADNVLSGFLK